MAIDLSGINPIQTPVVTLGDALIAILKNKHAAENAHMSNQMARINLKSLGQLNQARLHQINQLTEGQRAQNSLRNIQANLAPVLNQAKVNLLNAQTDRARNPLSGMSPNSLMAKQAYVNGLINTQGLNSPQTQNAINDLNLQRDQLRSQIKYRNALASTADKRVATPTTKSMIESQSIQNTGNPLGASFAPLSPQLQDELNTQLALKRAKNTTDSATRARINAGRAVDNTISTIDPDAASKFVGLQNRPKKYFEEFMSSLGRPSKDYEAYVSNKNAIKTLASQIRKFLGDSISEANMKELTKLIDYDTISSNPQLWKKNFLKQIDIFKKDQNAYMRGLNDPSTFKNNNVKADKKGNSGDVLGLGL